LYFYRLFTKKYHPFWCDLPRSKYWTVRIRFIAIRTELYLQYECFQGRYRLRKRTCSCEKI